MPTFSYVSVPEHHNGSLVKVKVSTCTPNAKGQAGNQPQPKVRVNLT